MKIGYNKIQSKFPTKGDETWFFFINLFLSIKSLAGKNFKKAFYLGNKFGIALYRGMHVFFSFLSNRYRKFPASKLCPIFETRGGATLPE